MPLVLPMSLAWHHGVAIPFTCVHVIKCALLSPPPQASCWAAARRCWRPSTAARRGSRAPCRRRRCQGGSACVFFRSLSALPVLLALHGAVRTWAPRTVHTAQLHSRFRLVFSRLLRAKD